MAGVDLAVGLAIGGWFASAIIGKVVDKAKTHLGDNWESYKGGKHMLTRLDAALPRMQAVINWAEMQPTVENDGLEKWLRQLKDVAYDADDVLDDLELRHAGDDGKKGKSKVSAFASSSLMAVKHLIVPEDRLKNLKDILKKIDGIAAGVCDFIQLVDKESKDAQQRRRESSSLLLDDKLFGRDHERDAILGLLLPWSSDEPESHDKSGASSSTGLGLRVIPIVGIGGVGKSALAKLIYNHHDITREFDVRLWVSVPDNCDTMKKDEDMIKNIAKHMIHNLVATTSANAELKESSNSDLRRKTTLEATLVPLGNFLRNKKFLIVLDDLRDEMGTVWAGLHPILSYGADGSAVLVTTQCQKTAKMIGTVDPIELAALGESYFRQLFKHYAFGNKKIEAEKLRELRSIGRKIESKLNGLPLAGKVVGRLLQSDLDVDQWKRVLGSEWWELKFCSERILPSLGLSFQYLKPKLKQCFAYCSIFPKGYIFEKERLVQMWMAQGFIQPDEEERMRMEDIGIEWFNELTNRSFFQPAWNNKFVMHDLMLELAVSVSLKECFVLKDESTVIPKGIRHLTLRTDKLYVLIKYMNRLKGLRTILFFGDYDAEEFVKVLSCLFEQSRSLRVMDLSDSKIEILPEAKYLSHLRYLDLSYNKFDYLPTRFSRLFHMQVLNLRGCHFRSLPKDIKNLIKLRHLYGDGDTLALVSSIGKLTCLQELMEFRVKSVEGHRIRELKHLRELRESLVITDLGRVRSGEEATEAGLKDKEHLQALQLRWDSTETTKFSSQPYTKISGSNKHWQTVRKREAEEIVQNHAEEIVQKRAAIPVLEALKPHCNLKELTISKYPGDKSPTWMVEDHLSSLHTLTLVSCYNWDKLPPLGKLQSLKALHIENMNSIIHVDDQLYGQNKVVFPSLEELVIKKMDKCERWLNVEQGRQLFPRLRKLHIVSCGELRRFPLFGLTPSVVELVIKDCGLLGSAHPQYIQYLTSLKILEITSYPHETCIDLQSLDALEELRFQNCPGLTLVEGQHSLALPTSLKLLQIRKCPSLILEKASPAAKDVVHDHASLTHLDTDIRLLMGQGCLATCKFPELKVLEIHGEARDIIAWDGDKQKEWFQAKTSLKELHLLECLPEEPHQLECLPEEPHQLECLPDFHLKFIPPSVEKLSISLSDDIFSHISLWDSIFLPPDCMPASLKELHVSGYPELEEWCQKEVGPEWPKISHIPYIRINGKTVQML